MNKKDIEYLRDIKYFHQEKGDMTRFSDFDVERLKE